MFRDMRPKVSPKKRTDPSERKWKAEIRELKQEEHKKDQLRIRSFDQLTNDLENYKLPPEWMFRKYSDSVHLFNIVLEDQDGCLIVQRDIQVESTFETALWLTENQKRIKIDLPIQRLIFVDDL